MGIRQGQEAVIAINDGPFSVPGIRIGHWTDPTESTGCTVLLTEHCMPAAVEVRGGAPGTRETDLLGPGKTAQRLDAVLLTGGSAFGLSAADGVMRWLHEQGRGFPTRMVPVPLVSAAVVFDLVGDDPVWPGADAGYHATSTASDEWSSARQGVGRGVRASKANGPESAIPTGIGVAQIETPAGTVSAIFAANPFGDILDDQTNERLTASADADQSCEATLLAGSSGESMSGENTVIGVVACDRTLDHDGLMRLAMAGQSGIARVVRPAHTPVDGDTVFAIATNEGPIDLHDLIQLTTGAQVATARAVSNAARLLR